MARIETLTEEQRARFPEFRKKWTEIGLCTDPSDRSRAEAGIRLSYEIAKLTPPDIQWAGSPLACAIARAFSLMLPKKATKAEALKKVKGPVWDSIMEAVEPDKRKSFITSCWKARVPQKELSTSSFGDVVWEGIMDSVNGQHDADWLAFYDYFRVVCGLEDETSKLTGLMEVAKASGWFFPYEELCWAAERHSVVSLNGEGQIHAEEGPAIGFADGFSIYALNGVRVPRILVVTPAAELPAKMAIEEKNVEIRREIVRKVGIERLCKDLGAKTLSKKHGYELIELNLGDRKRPYLKMSNPSITAIHVEGVHPDCRTVEAALKWRNQSELLPSQLS